MATFTDSFWRALADYRIQFPNLAALGTAAATWRTEYDRVRTTAMASVLITGSSTDGGSGSGQRNFSQEVLLDALHCRRAELDDDYTIPEHLAQFEAEKVSRAAAGSRRNVLRFSP